MNVKITPTREIVVLGIDQRPTEDLIWCASTFGQNRLFWIDGYLICTEVYEKAFEHEILKKEFPISQICYTTFPKYRRFYEVEKGVNIPIVNATGMKIFQTLLKAILKTEEEGDS